MYSYNKQVRQVLRDIPDGLTVAQVASLINAPYKTINRLLRTMPDAYIDRWQKINAKNNYAAVWCVVVPPENCPKPNQKETYDIK